MSDNHEQPPALNQRRAGPVLLLALLLSAAFHGITGSVLFSAWPRTPPAVPRVLTLTLITVPEAPQLVTQNTPMRIAHRSAGPEANASALPVPVAAADVALDVVRTEAVQPVVMPAPESAAALVAKVPDAVHVPGRVDEPAPPQFHVAYFNCPPAEYPLLAQKLGLEGKVVVRVQVDSARKPKLLAVTQTSGASLLDDAALKAANGCIYNPPRKELVPIAYVVDVPVRFQLQQ